MNELLNCARQIADALPPERRHPYPAIAVLFDGDRFVGAPVINSWQSCMIDILVGPPFDGLVFIWYESPPPLHMQRSLITQKVYVHGAIHGTPCPTEAEAATADSPA